MHKTRLLIYLLLIIGLLNSCASIEKHRYKIIMGSCAVVGVVAGTAYAIKNVEDSSEGGGYIFLGGFFGEGLGLGINWLFFEKDDNQNILREIGKNNSESIGKYSPNLLLTNHASEPGTNWLTYPENPAVDEEDATPAHMPCAISKMPLADVEGTCLEPKT